MNTEKLTLEMVAHYLPYGLKMANGKYIGEIESVMIAKGEFRISCSGWYEKFSDGKYLPILRPMSDYKPYSDSYTIGGGIFAKTGIDINNELQIVVDSDLDQPFHYYVDLMEVNKALNILLEYHFDVFGLIEKGLAIDINTLEKISPAI